MSRPGLEHLGWTAAHLSAYDGDAEALARALGAGGDAELANARAADGKTPLHLALLMHSREKSGNCSENGGERTVLRLLLEAGADTNARDSKGRAGLHMCCGDANNGPALAALLLEHGADLEAKDSRGNTPFLAAARNGAVVLMDFFFTSGANTSHRDADGMNALHVAASGVSDVSARAACQFLISAGADIEEASAPPGPSALLIPTEDKETKPPMRADELAKAHGNTLTARLLTRERRKIGRERRMMFRQAQAAILQGDEDALRKCISRDTEKLVQYGIGKKNTTLLMEAVKRGDLSIFRMLLEAGSRLSAKNNTQNNILHIAARHSSDAIIDWMAKGMYVGDGESENDGGPYLSKDTLTLMLQERNVNGESPLDLAQLVCDASSTSGDTAAVGNSNASSSLLRLSQAVSVATLRQASPVRHDSEGWSDFIDPHPDMSGQHFFYKAGNKDGDDKNNQAPDELFQWLTSLGLSHHYDGLCEDGWSDMERVKLIDDREECKSAGMQKPGEIKLLLKSIQKLNATAATETGTAAALATAANNIGQSDGNIGVQTHREINGSAPLLRSRSGVEIRRAWHKPESVLRQATQELHSSASSSSTSGMSSPIVPGESSHAVEDQKNDHKNSNSDQAAAAAAACPELLVPYDELTVVKFELGQGSFGVVHRAVWHGMDVAVKCLKKNEGRNSAASVKEVYREASMMRRVNNHYAILRLVGICEIPAGCELDNSPGAAFGGVAIVTEFCSAGNLEEILYLSSLVNRRHELCRADVLRMAIDAAAGVLHLHRANMVRW